MTGEAYPAYRRLMASGELDERLYTLQDMLSSCHLCPRDCKVDRTDGKVGFCKGGLTAKVASYGPHFGEEAPLVGSKGSGTIFFSGCNLGCCFCQNYEISHLCEGREVSSETLAGIMLRLQERGCHNINLVTPTHVMPNILNATRIALNKGLHVPLVYNTSGYERVEMVKLLDGIVDIYMPDMKYMDSDKAAKYSAGASDYPAVTQKAVIEMNRQVGKLHVDKRGIALRGLMIRHLVMPNRVAGTEKFVKWVAKSLSRATYVNIMTQYRVEYKAYEYPEINRGITVKEFLEAMDWAKKYGLTNLDPHSLAIRDFYRQRSN